MPQPSGFMTVIPPHQGFIHTPHQGFLPPRHGYIPVIPTTQGLMLPKHKGFLPSSFLGDVTLSHDCDAHFEQCKARNKAYKKAHEDRKKINE
jgi:hypothetical protein